MIISCYDKESGQLAIINRLTLTENPEAVASEFCRLVQNEMTACPELKSLITEPSFPSDKQTINAILSFRSVYPDEPEKRLAVIESLFTQNRLNTDALTRITNNIEKSLETYPEEIQYLFFDGQLPFSDAVFSAIDILLGKKWDLPTSISLIEKASTGKFQPEHFQTRLNKLVSEYEDTFSALSHNEDGTKSVISSVDDAINSIGFTDEQREAWDRITGEKPAVKNSVRETFEDIVPAQQAEENAPEVHEEESPFADDDPEDFYESEFSTLADSMQRANNSTDLAFEKELLEKNRNKNITGDFVFASANEYCKNCRKNRVYNLNVINYCLECYVPVIVGQIQDIENDEN